MFGKMSIEETRAACKGKIEALEFALRRLIDLKFTQIYGPDYFNAVDSRQESLFSTSMRSHAAERMKEQPGRYQRPVDTLLLEDEARTICKFFNHFSAAFSSVAHNREAVKWFFDRIIAARNPLYHANPISLRQAEQVYCYTNDILDSIREFYRGQAVKLEYDAPLILKMSDSLGNVKHRSAGMEHMDFNHGFTGADDVSLKVGDVLTIDVEIDPAFSPDSYNIYWASSRIDRDKYSSGPSFQIQITEAQVSASFDVQCRVVSNKNWHRKGGHDDFMIISYKALPY